MLILKNEPEKLLIIKDRCKKTNPNEPKNEAGKLLKKLSGGKNEPKDEPKILHWLSLPPKAPL
jgi:hypothetical protein